MNRNRKIISLVLTIVMLLTVFPMSVMADTTDWAASESALPEQYILNATQGIGTSVPATGGVDAVDFSENGMLAAAYHASSPYKYYGDPDSGGLPDMATAYFARWGGPVTEGEDPYANPAIAGNVKYRTGFTPFTRISDVLMIPHLSTDAADDIARIKQLVYDKGAAYVSFQCETDNLNTPAIEGYMNFTTHAYYMPPKQQQSGSGGHAVTIVGWDDNYSKANFLAGKQPSKNGAFIIKNSWGTGGVLGDGYFYISYEDKCIAKLYKITQSESGYYTSDTAMFIAGDKDVESYDHNYQYDPYGYTDSIGFNTNPTHYYMANVFTASSAETLKAISFYTTEYNVPYNVFIVKGTTNSLTFPIPATATLPSTAAAAVGTQDYPGYHTVKLNKDITLTAGQKFAVIVRLPGSLSYPVCIENQTYVDYEETIPSEKNLTTGAAQSYLVNGGSWVDLQSVGFGNLCIKAFTVDGTTGGVTEYNEQLLPGDSEIAPGESSVVPGTSEIAPGESELVPGTSEIGLGESQLPPSDIEPLNLVSFLDSLNLPEEDEFPPTGSVEENGFIPGAKPQRYSLYSDNGAELATGAALPAMFDLRDTGIITSVKDQGNIGSCWTFAATASAESTYLKNKGINNNISVTFTQSSKYLRNTTGSGITLTANAPIPSMVTAYTWTVKSGTGSITYTPSTTSTQILNYKASGVETEIDVDCKVTYSNGDEFSHSYRIPVTNYGTGDGTVAKPYEVSTPAGLQLIDCFSGDKFKGLYFEQTADISLVAYKNNWKPIGERPKGLPFAGNYDGGSYIISFAPDTTITLEPDNIYSFGLFAYASGGTIQNVIIDAPLITLNTSGTYNALYLFGGLVGTAEDEKIKNCAVSGRIKLTGTATENAGIGGGFAGGVYNSVIEHSSFTGSIHSDYFSHLGGFAGQAGTTEIKNSYASVSIWGDSGIAGGFIGSIADGSKISDCYAIGTLETDESNLAGMAHVFVDDTIASSFTRCYASVETTDSGTSYAFTGGSNTAKLINCYYDKTKAAGAVILGAGSGKLTGLTAQQMTQKASFTGFDFINTWAFFPGQNEDMPAFKNAIAKITGFEMSSEMPKYVLNKQSVAVKGTALPAYASPQYITVVPVRGSQEFAEGDNFGNIKGIKRGKNIIFEICPQGDPMHPFAGISNFIVLDKIADITYDGTPDYAAAVTTLINILTGKTDLADFWLLDADFSSGDIDSEKNDLSLTDLVMMKQASVGARTFDYDHCAKQILNTIFD